MKKNIVFFLSLFFLSFVFVACNKDKQEVQNKVLIAVETKTLKSETIQQYISLSSRVMPIDEVDVVSKISGKVKSVNVNLGDYVKKGDILFTIDDKDIILQVNQANAGLSSAKANYDLNLQGNMKNQIQQLKTTVESYEIEYKDLLENLEDTKYLYNEGVVAKNDLEKLQTSVDKLKLQLDMAKKTLEITENDILNQSEQLAKSSLNQAQVSLDMANSQLNSTVVKADINGVISSNNISVGQMISPQISPITISNMDNVKLSFEVSEEIIDNIKKGTKVYVSIKAISDVPFEAEISNISDVASSKSFLYKAQVIMDNKNHIIKPGMSANIKLVLESKDNVIIVPVSAIINKDDKQYVYVVDDKNIAHKQIVKTGIYNDENIQILSGLDIGQKVVVKGQDFISDNLEVNVLTK